MEFDHGVSVAPPIDAVWTAMTHIERIAPCVPNARVTGRAGADSYDFIVHVRRRPAGDYVGAQEHARRARRRHSPRGAGGRRRGFRRRPPADATIAIVLTRATERTDAAMHSCVEVSGVAALIGADTLAGFAADTLATFAANLEALLARVPLVPRPV